MSDIGLQAMLEIDYFDPKWSFAKLWVVFRLSVENRGNV